MNTNQYPSPLLLSAAKAWTLINGRIMKRYVQWVDGSRRRALFTLPINIVLLGAIYVIALFLFSIHEGKKL